MSVLAMATSQAKPDGMEALVEAALDHAKALQRQPGCQGTYVLRDPASNTQVSVSIFEDEGALKRALQATRPVIAKHDIERLVESPPRFQVFDVC